MVALWCVIGVILTAVSVSTLGASFSVFGLSQLFSGASTAIVAAMASLELAKFVIAAYLHQTWRLQNRIFKSYLSLAVVILSLITSMGIFGFFSNAYQGATTALDTENIKLASLKGELIRAQAEVERINRAVEEIPASRITRKLTARKEAEPELARLSRNIEQINATTTKTEVQNVDLKRKVGPIIYIARAFNLEVDQVVKYLILILIFVFDPLAICLVIASSQALEFRRKMRAKDPQQAFEPQHDPIQAPVVSQAPVVDESEPQVVAQMRFIPDSKKPGADVA